MITLLTMLIGLICPRCANENIKETKHETIYYLEAGPSNNWEQTHTNIDYICKSCGYCYENTYYGEYDNYKQQIKSKKTSEKHFDFGNGSYLMTKIDTIVDTTGHFYATDSSWLSIDYTIDRLDTIEIARMYLIFKDIKRQVLTIESR